VFVTNYETLAYYKICPFATHYGSIMS